MGEAMTKADLLAAPFDQQLAWLDKQIFLHIWATKARAENWEASALGRATIAEVIDKSFDLMTATTAASGREEQP